MIEFFYRHSYSLGQIRGLQLHSIKSAAIKGAWSASETRCHIQVYVIAQKYGLGDLQLLAKMRILDSLKPTKQHSEFHAVISDIYRNTQPSDVLRKAVAKYASKHAKEEFAAPDDRFGDLIVSLPEFGRDLAKCLCDREQSRKLKETVPSKHLEICLDTSDSDN
jgi:hypothetical protein